MKARFTLILMIAAIISGCTMATTMPEQAAQGIAIGDSVVMTAEVIAIHKADRTVTLLGSEGNVVEIEVGPEARNFDQIKVGDMVRVEYYESVAIYIGEKGTQPDVKEGIVAGRSAKGDKPAGVVIESIDISATVKSINKFKRTIKLIMPDGKVVTRKVDKSIKAFDNLKKGDSIHVRLTEAVAISIEKS
jgi:hypothetical protein